MKPCPSYSGYSVEADGRVFTHRRRFGLGKGRGGGVTIDPLFARVLKPYRGQGGYAYVSVSTKRGQRSVAVHLLLLDAFVGPMPDGQETRHLDGDFSNNTLSNLAYGTPKQNAEDRIRCGVRMEGESHPRAKLSASGVLDIKRRVAGGETMAAVARSLGIGGSTVRDIINGRRWKSCS